MKKITKRESPDWFEAWKTNFRTIHNREPHYKTDFSTGDQDGAKRRKNLRQQLVEEQGAICCYCMRRISVNTSHIEHFWPKDVFLDKDLNYDNLFASCNGVERAEDEYVYEMDEHCGHRKNDWWRTDMVCLTDAGIEAMFRYFPNGEVKSVQGRSTSNIAQEMIHNLGLDSYHLVRERRLAIEASEFYDAEPYTAEEIRDFIEYYSNKNNGFYEPYCKAIVDCLETIL